MHTPRRIPVLLFVLLAVTTLHTLTAIPARADGLSPVPKTQPADQELTLKVGLYQNAPKIYTDQDGVAAGFWPDLLHYIAAEEGWQIEWVSGTWDQGLMCLETVAVNHWEARSDVCRLRNNPKSAFRNGQRRTKCSKT